VTNKLRKTIAWWQIMCALMGIAVFVASWFNILPNGRRWVDDGIGRVNFVGGLLFFAFAFAAGRGLLLERRWSIAGCLWIQLLQAVSFSFLNGPKMSIAAGPAIDFTVGSAAVGAQVAFHSSFFLGKLVQGAAWEVTINVLALFWAGMLWRLLRTTASVERADSVDQLPSPSAL
jgi:hypothetical protein